ncbi:uncharacterized protein HKW66_Vig0187380 [Vigna angularis]|uniref:Putative plant transposon protein domain-containing protein n=1 Tax=Phaseolus angularis TaxID=3914 RepID=A0A8T0KVJ6_PHAAN|nr:uncharacterized protein HKW66_Vig0187380 [Vigna angularis]
MVPERRHLFLIFAQRLVSHSELILTAGTESANSHSARWRIANSICQHLCFESFTCSDSSSTIVCPVYYFLQMAPPKSTQEKKRKTTQGSSSRSQPAEAQEENLVLNYDQDRFISEANSDRFHQNIMSMALLPERRIELKPGEYDHIQEELEKRKWNFVLANLPDEIDEVLVKEFYANAWEPDHSQPHSRVSKVRGKLVRYDRRSLNRILNTLMFQPCPLGVFMSSYPDHDLIASTLCLPGYGYQLGTSGTPASGVAGVSDITLKLQPPLNKKFFDRNCTNRGEFSAMNAPPPVPPPRRNVRAARPPIAPSVPSPDLFTRYMQQSLARQDDIRDWCTSMRQGQVSLQDSMYNLPLGIPDFPPDSLMTGAQFAAQIPWPEGRPESRWGSAYPGAPKLELDEQEDMMAGDGDEEEEEPDPRWTQQSYHSQESQWRSRSDGSW